tara:strand:+ start:823 stop:1365 length:543 start_codon:yes stop_codon:yes gene_type:complete
MSENSPIKDALYEKIHEIGQEQIHTLLSNRNFVEIFEKIYTPTINKITNIEEFKKHGILAESFTHYLFTEMLIPSQRKVIFENIELDMVIPNLIESQKDSHNTILILFVKTSNTNEIKEKIRNMKKIQNDDSKICIISKDEIEVTQKLYFTTKESFSIFLNDIKNFIEKNKMNKLNIFKT